MDAETVQSPESSASGCHAETITENGSTKQDVTQQPDSDLNGISAHVKAPDSSESGSPQLGTVEQADGPALVPPSELRPVGGSASNGMSHTDTNQNQDTDTQSGMSPESPNVGTPNSSSTSNGTSAPIKDASTLNQSSTTTPHSSSVTNPPSSSSSTPGSSGGATAEMTEVSLHDDEPDDAADGGRPPDLEASSPAATDGACSPLSELSDEPMGGGRSVEERAPPTAGRRPPPNGLRVDVEAEARLFNLTDKVASLTDENRALQDKLKRAQDESGRLSAENGKERAHIETLEQQLSSLRAQLDGQREEAAEAARRQQEAARALELDLTGRLSRSRAQFEAACRDKDKMVLRYAQSEKSVIDAKREAATADRRVKEALREKDMLVSKVNHMVQERNRMSQQMEAKVQEAKNLSKESAKLKEEVESRDVRIKWLQNKMKQEADSYKDGQLRMESLLKELREAQETIRRYKLAEDNRSSALDKELREEKARRMVEEKLKQDSTNKEQALTAQLQEAQERCSRLAQESAANLERALAAETALEPVEAARARLQEEVAALRHQVETLLHDSAELDETRATLERERERLAASQAEVAALQASQADLQADLDGCHAKEADLLDFTQKLTEKNVELQSQISGFQARSQAAEFEARQFSSCREELEDRLADLTGRLAREQEARTTDNQLLARRLAERTRQVEELTRRAEDAENETAIVRKKLNSSVRELQRELAQARRRQESQDTSPAPTPADGLSQASRASSSVSLHEAAPADPTPVVHVTAPVEPDRQVLIERIVRLQRQVARRSEKIDFLEDHVNNLVEEVRRKSRLLQHYMLREEAGALGSQDRDQAKSEMMRKGGIMASVYGSHSKDQAMTLELSLEINKKLQSVLEDTLLKNMTLKDNMNVLGEEIASLTEQNRQLRRQ
ncbi:coiled-coil domain-containing protein 186-like [Amphibalanus amphitrite]|uniref:coiled-coil domain-containing protein 186-like n=1 Tax=Amphibalanus amphitrite TaxID=1232801 RepID=UPI001C9112EB|nr:coiled-coil domain-containing protein 186-like [Amphibalanus amphitrite]